MVRPIKHRAVDVCQGCGREIKPTQAREWCELDGALYHPGCAHECERVDGAFYHIVLPVAGLMEEEDPGGIDPERGRA
jgi:hypothetical protein